MATEFAKRKHKLITKKIERALDASPIGTTDGLGDDTPILVKFFSIQMGWTWYVTEARRTEDGDWLFFGLVDGNEKELGYFSYRELENARFNGFVPAVERDLHFGKKTLKDVR